MLRGLKDLNSLTRDQTQPLAVNAPSPKHWTAREFPTPKFYVLSFLWLLALFITSLRNIVGEGQWHPTPVLLPVKSPWKEEPGGLQSMGSLRVGRDWATSLSLFTVMHWRRTWQPTPVFLPGESQGWGSLVGCRLWGRTESDMTEVT